MVVFTSSSSLVRSVSSLIRGEHDDNKLTLNSQHSVVGGGLQQCRHDASIGFFSPPPPSSYRILACSLSPLHSRLTLEELARFGDRELCSDRRDFLSQLHPKTFAGSTSKILFQQVSLVGMRFVTDQLEVHIKKDDEVASGKISQEDADEECEEWSKREWKLRWTAFPERFMVGLVKYHVATLVMRLYEQVAALYISPVQVDLLTQDTFQSAKRTAEAEPDRVALRNSMFKTCLWAYAFSYLADLTVQLALLIGPAAYHYHKRRQERRERRLKALDGVTEMKEIDEEADFAPKFMVLLHKSTMLTISRVSCWLATSAGAAFGSVYYPGWGTVMGGNMADGLVSGMFDELLAR